MYWELRLCIDALAVICVVLGVSLFAGTKRETLWDRNNLVGLLLVGIALSTHGGFDTILRSGEPPLVLSGLGHRARLRLILAHLSTHRDSKAVPGVDGGQGKHQRS